MARYLFRYSILGPRALDAAQINAAAAPAFARFGFDAEPVSITNVKGVAAPVMREVAGEPVFVANVPPWGEIELDNTAAARNVRVLTQASQVIEGVLPPDSSSGRAGSAVLSNAIYAAVNAAFGSSGFYNLTGGAREAGLVVSGGGGGTFFLLGLGIAGLAYLSTQKHGSMFGSLGRGHSKRVARTLGGDTRNSQGLTWLEWKYAAAAKSSIKQRRAWRAGEDPTEWRADPTT